MMNKIKDIFKKMFNDKKKLIIMFVLLIVIVLIIIMINLFRDKEILNIVTNTDGEKFSNEYEDLNGEESEEGKVYPKVNIPYNNVFEYSSVREVVDIFKNKDHAVIYIGYSSCVYCRSAVQVLYDTAKDTRIKKIYYLNIDNGENYDELIQVLDKKFITEEGEIYVPVVLFVDSGKVVSHNKGTLFSQDDPYIELNESQKKGLSEIYKYGIQDVINAMNNDNSNDSKVVS